MFYLQLLKSRNDGVQRLIEWPGTTLFPLQMREIVKLHPRDWLQERVVGIWQRRWTSSLLLLLCLLLI